MYSLPIFPDNYITIILNCLTPTILNTHYSTLRDFLTFSFLPTKILTTKWFSPKVLRTLIDSSHHTTVIPSSAVAKKEGVSRTMLGRFLKKMRINVYKKVKRNLISRQCCTSPGMLDVARLSSNHVASRSI